MKRQNMFRDYSESTLEKFFKPKKAVYEILGIKKGEYLNLDLSLDVLTLYIKFIKASNSDIDVYIKRYCRDLPTKDYVTYEKLEKLGECNTPRERLETILNIIDKRDQMPLIANIMFQFNLGFGRTGGFKGLYTHFHKQIRCIDIEDLELEIAEIFHVDDMSDFLRIVAENLGIDPYPSMSWENRFHIRSLSKRYMEHVADIAKRQ